MHPSDPEQMLIGYNRGLIVLWDGTKAQATKTYVHDQQIEALCWHRSGDRFVSAHNDGSYVIWNTMDSNKPDQAPKVPYGPFPCKPITSISWKTTKK